MSNFSCRKVPVPGLGAVGSEASKRTNSASTTWLLKSERILISNRGLSAMRTGVFPGHQRASEAK
jgi:hypothetical protein